MPRPVRSKAAKKENDWKNPRQHKGAPVIFGSFKKC